MYDEGPHQAPQAGKLLNASAVLRLVDLDVEFQQKRRSYELFQFGYPSLCSEFTN
jgi:hypothetical protein